MTMTMTTTMTLTTTMIYKLPSPERPNQIKVPTPRVPITPCNMANFFHGPRFPGLGGSTIGSSDPPSSPDSKFPSLDVDNVVFVVDDDDDDDDDVADVSIHRIEILLVLLVLLVLVLWMELCCCCVRNDGVDKDDFDNGVDDGNGPGDDGNGNDWLVVFLDSHFLATYECGRTWNRTFRFVSDDEIQRKSPLHE